MLSRPCALCGSIAPINKSHIVPDFVRRWAVDAYKNEEFWDVNDQVPTKGFVQPRMLCTKCENRLQKRGETPFAEQFFKPYQSERLSQLRYDAWLNYFCVSVGWRVLHNHLVNLRERPYWAAKWDESLKGNLRAQTTQVVYEMWKAYLLEKTSDPGTAQYVFLIDAFCSRPKGIVPDRVNWAGALLARAIYGHYVDVQPLWGDGLFLIAANLFGILLISSISPAQHPDCRNWIIHDSGTVQIPEDFALPGFIAEWINYRTAQLLRDRETHPPWYREV